ncbi:MAG: Txe/YoeB family addiction module toxin [Candidatus Aminicenantes bacterium]|nr:Txe/YoeB family addiction module toxin [Candidatus Aminicenantes bacterium]
MTNWIGAVRDSKKIARAGLKPNVMRILEILKENPFQAPPFYEKLVGNLNGFFSRRINIQHRLVYEVFGDKKIIRILKMWSHYE